MATRQRNTPQSRRRPKGDIHLPWRKVPARLENQIENLLLQLAHILLERGITPAQICHIARNALVRAAAENSKFRNGKINQSRVAVLTGLRRAEVRMVLHAKANTRLERSDAPLQKILRAWITNNRYLDRAGKPLRLALTGSGVSFRTLVKEQCSDIPHRAVLAELLRVSAVHQIGSEVELRSLSALRSTRRFAHLAQLMPAFADVVRLVPRSESLSTHAYVRRLSLHARNNKELAIVRERCDSSINSLLTGLHDTLQPQMRSKRRKTTPPSCAVTVLLVENKRPGLLQSEVIPSHSPKVEARVRRRMRKASRRLN